MSQPDPPAPALPLDYQSRPGPSGRNDDLAYILPMGIFLLLTWVGGHWPSTFAVGYVVKTVLTAVALILLRRRYTKISWDYWWLGIVVGVIGIVQWVGMEKLLLHFWPNYPRVSVDVYDPTQSIHNPVLMWSFIAIRWAGMALVVPFMEELFWRDYLWRSVSSPNDFKLPAVGEWDAKAFVLVALFFASVHVQWMTAIVWGAMIGALLVYTRSLGACIICHGVTNFLLGAYVLFHHPRDWYFW